MFSLLKCNFFTFILSLVVLLTGCQAIVEKTFKNSDFIFQRGVVSFEEGELVFQACYSNTKHRLTDQSNRLLKATTNALSQNVYTEVSILPSVKGEPWQVQQVHLIGGNIKTCFFELHANHYRAAGENPSWIADVRDDGIYIRGAYGLQQLVFPLMETTETANSIEWTSQIKAASTYQVNLLLTHEHC